MTNGRAAEGALAHLREHAELVRSDVKLIRERLRGGEGARVLDVGAGRGDFVIEARRAGIDAIALDLDLDAPAVWRPLAVPGVLGSGGSIPFGASSFSVVRMKEVLEHVERPLVLVREARRILRPGGLFIAHVPTPWSQFYPVANFWDDYTHVRPISRFGLVRLMADAGMQLERIDGYMSGRNSVERLLGRALGRVFPHIYKVVARAPSNLGG